MDESMAACEIQVPVLPVDGMLATHFVQPRRVQVSLKQGPMQRYTEITHDPLLFSVAQGIFWLSTEWLSRSTLHLKQWAEGSLYSLYCVVLQMLSLCADSDKIPARRWDLNLYSPSFWANVSFTEVLLAETKANNS